jgi:hypothetical protein
MAAHQALVAQARSRAVADFLTRELVRDAIVCEAQSALPSIHHWRRGCT